LLENNGKKEGIKELSALAKVLSEEIPDLIEKVSGISVTVKKTPFSNPSYLQSRFQYSGPISKNTVKVDISKEKFIGEIIRKSVPQMFD
jgi:hypothetical protein